MKPYPYDSQPTHRFPELGLPKHQCALFQCQAGEREIIFELKSDTQFFCAEHSAENEIHNYIVAHSFGYVLIIDIQNKRYCYFRTSKYISHGSSGRNFFVVFFEGIGVIVDHQARELRFDKDVCEKFIASQEGIVYYENQFGIKCQSNIEIIEDYSEVKWRKINI